MATVRKRLAYFLMVFVCGIVSVYDNVLNYVTMETLREQEQNPVASMIIESLGVYGLIYIKSLGTLVSVVIMLCIVYSRWRFAIIPVFIFQVGLFCYLTFYTSQYFFGPDMLVVPKLVMDFYDWFYGLGLGD